MGSTNRRRDPRIPLQISLNEHHHDRSYRSLSLNISTDGIRPNPLFQSGQPICGARRTSMWVNCRSTSTSCRRTS